MTGTLGAAASAVWPLLGDFLPEPCRVNVRAHAFYEFCTPGVGCAAVRPVSHLSPTVCKVRTAAVVLVAEIKSSVVHGRATAPQIIHWGVCRTHTTGGSVAASIAADIEASECQASGGQVQTASYEASADPRPPMLSKGRRPILTLQAGEGYGCSGAAAWGTVEKPHRLCERPFLQQRRSNELIGWQLHIVQQCDLV